MKKLIHILMFIPLLLAAGCVRDMEPFTPASGVVLTVRCEDPDLTKSTPVDGETRFNENLIKSVDFFFYPSTDLSGKAAYHKRFDLEEDPVSYSDSENRWEATFTLVLKTAEAEKIFPTNGSSAKVYAVVNYDGDLTAGETTRAALAAIPKVTDFAEEEKEYVQGSFLMDGEQVVTYDESASVNVSGTIEVKRFAAKLTTAIFVANEVTIKHTNPTDDPDEVWKPVLHTMRIYLVDGAKNVTLGTTSSDDNQDPKFFSYSAEEHRRPFVRNDADNTEYLAHTSVGSGDDEKIYYNTYPMYSYPVKWESGPIDYTQPLPEQPYLKLELDWRRTEANNHSFDQRKYYYKVVLPVESLERNNWYHLNIDVSILGAEAEEGQAILLPTCYILNWQNKSVPIDKYAVISKARYLSVDTKPKYLNNLTTLSIPFLSSHDVKIVEGTQKATRPYYGVINDENHDQVVNHYNTKYHAWVREKNGAYYLEYQGQNLAFDDEDNPIGKEAYEPATWIRNTSTTIEFEHALQNVYTKDDFDYSPYTIEFDIVHTDLTEGVSPYDEYLKHITIIQYPGIYIESCPNSDADIRATSDNNGKPFYPNADDKPWPEYPWGYVFIDGGRFLRTGDTSTEDYYKLSTVNRREYQWRTVWYTGGGRDIFRINVTVLPDKSEFIIGDPRIDGYDKTIPVLGYSFVNNGSAAERAILPDRTGNDSNFTPARVVNGDANKELALTGETRPLMYYRPTEASDRTTNMLAPAYRISTKLGGTEYGTLNANQAKWRCAGYQEDGFPGGRWRIPTLSEIKFIAQLSAKGVFESMFSGVYWSANGVVNVNRASGTVTPVGDTMAYLRCVYDAWYWGDEQWDDRWEFVWGDRE